MRACTIERSDFLLHTSLFWTYTIKRHPISYSKDALYTDTACALATFFIATQALRTRVACPLPAFIDGSPLLIKF